MSLRDGHLKDCHPGKSQFVSGEWDWEKCDRIDDVCKINRTPPLIPAQVVFLDRAAQDAWNTSIRSLLASAAPPPIPNVAGNGRAAQTPTTVASRPRLLVRLPMPSHQTAAQELNSEDDAPVDEDEFIDWEGIYREN